jgi:stringent starvation protein B
MTSNRPYLIRAIHEWISDNDEAPFVIVNLDYPGCLVPPEFADQGSITFNLSWDATHNLIMGNQDIRFSTRFQGLSHDIVFSPLAVIGIYSRESGQGMMFEPMDSDSAPLPVEQPPEPEETARKPILSVVSSSRKKNDDEPI